MSLSMDSSQDFFIFSSPSLSTEALRGCPGLRNMVNTSYGRTEVSSIHALYTPETIRHHARQASSVSLFPGYASPVDDTDRAPGDCLSVLWQSSGSLVEPLSAGSAGMTEIQPALPIWESANQASRRPPDQISESSWSLVSVPRLKRWVG